MMDNFITAARAAIAAIEGADSIDTDMRAAADALSGALAAAEAPTAPPDQIAENAWKLLMVYFGADGEPLHSRTPEPEDLAAEAQPGAEYKRGYEEALNDCIRNGVQWARSMFANDAEHIASPAAPPQVPQPQKEA